MLSVLYTDGSRVYTIPIGAQTYSFTGPCAARIFRSQRRPAPYCVLQSHWPSPEIRKVELLSKRIFERDTFNGRSDGKIFAQNDRDLIQFCRRPDLRIKVAEAMLLDGSNRLQGHGWRQRIGWEDLFVELNLLIHLGGR